MLRTVLSAVLVCALLAGGPAVWWWDRRPAGAPTIHAKVAFWTLRWRAPDSLQARLDALHARERLALRRSQAIEAGQAAVGRDVGQRVDAAQAQIRWRTKTLIEKVPVYVTAETDARYRLPWGFVRLHDAAAADSGAPLPTVPDAASEPHDAPAPVEVSAAGRVVAENYGACHANAAQLAGWIEWAERVKAAGEAAPVR